MKLFKIREGVTWVDPFGDSHAHQSQYVRVLEIIETAPNGEVRMFDNGYEPPYACPILEASDGRTWVEIQNRVDYWGGTWYRPLFDEPRDPALDKHEVGPVIRYVTEREMGSKRCVNYDGQAVDLEGNRL